MNQCYSTGAVNGTVSYPGGLIGFEYYGTVTGSFWDMLTSGQTSSAGGTGRTTAQMKTQSTFSSAGWDFINIWSILEGLDYPRLRWEQDGGMP